MPHPSKSKRRERLLLYTMIVFIVFSYLLFDQLFSRELPPYALNLMSAILGTVVTIALMMLLMQYQMKSEQEKEFKAILFDKKLEIYREFLQTIFKMDDDNLIDKEEVQQVENLLGEIALVGGQDLIDTCSTFIVQLKSYGVLYTRSLVKKQREHYNTTFGELENFVSLDDLMQAFRDDLSVVGGSVSHLLERVVGIPYDQFRLIKDPNVVD